MGLVLKHVLKTPAGTFRYRRRVPDDLRSIIGKRELTEFLGETQKQASARYAKVHGKFDKLLRDALLKSRGATYVPKKELSELENWQGLRTRLKEMGFDPHWDGSSDWDNPEDEGSHRELMADILAERYPIDEETGHPIITRREDSALINAVRNGLGLPPSPTLEDAEKLYLKERVEGKSDEKKNRLHVLRVMGWTKAALDGNVELRRIKRSDAREVRDYLLTDAGNLAPTSVKRYLNTLRAVVNLAITEFDLDGMSNPFNGLEVKRQGLEKDDTPVPGEGPQRHPEAHSRTIYGAGPSLNLASLEGTGCRLSEIISRSPYGKSNLTPLSHRLDWRHIESVALGNGCGLTQPQDHAPVVTEWHWPSSEEVAEGLTDERRHV